MSHPATLRRLARNTVSVGTGRIVSQLLNLALLPIALAVIPPSEYGAYALLQIAALIGGVLMSFGLSTAFVAQFGADPRDPGRLLGRVLSEQWLLGGLVLALALWLAQPLCAWLDLEPYTPVLALLLAGEYCANAVLIFARWQVLSERHWQISLVAVLRSATMLGLLIALVVWQRWGLLGFAVAEASGKLIALGACLVLARRSWRPRLRLAALGRSLRLGIPATPDTIFFWLLVWAPLYVVREGDAAAAAGAFALAWRLALPLDLLGNSLAFASAERLIAAQRSRVTRVLRRWWRLGLALLGMATASLLALCPEILALLFPPEYAFTQELLPRVALGAMFLALYYFEWVGLSGSSRTWGLSAASGAGLAVIALAYVLLGWEASARTAAGIWAAGFLAMWSVARLLNPGVRLGNAAASGAAAVLSVAAGVALAGLPAAAGWLGAAAKLAVILLAGLTLGSVELIVRRRERLEETRGEDRFLDIPTYAEVARHLEGARSFLDIGCGEGFFLREVPIPRRVGIDPDLERLKAGRAEHPGLMLACARASALPFADDEFECAALIGVLPYVPEPEAALREAARVLARSGRLAVSAASRHRFYRWMGVYRLRQRTRAFSLDELSDLLHAAGFEVERAYERGLFFAPLLGSLYSLPARLDAWLGSSTSAMGRWGRWARAVTNPLIRWEYELARGPGYQAFVTGSRRG